MKKYTLLAILMCFSVVAKAQTSSGKHHIKYLDINSGNPDKGVAFVNNSKVVFTTTVSDKVINTQKYHPYLDFYTGTVGDDGAILEKKRLNTIKDKKISKNAASFSKDGKTVYFSANKYSKRKSRAPRYEMFKAQIDEAGNWQNIEKLPFNNRKFSYSHPTVNKDHSRLYFVSDASPSRGGTDIFYVEIKEDGSYGDPVNLGEKINTSGNETTPFIADNNFLYFSSDGRADALGGMDVYTVEAFENTFSDPLHLASPINSINDDLGYIVNTENKGFFASNRLQGRGNDDIYSFYIEPDKPVECLQEIVGTVRDKETEGLITNASITVVDEEGNEIHNLKTDDSGNYRFTLSCRNSFTVTATKVQYDKEEHIVNTANYFNAPPLEVNQLLEKQIKEVSEEKVVIKANPIYFGFDKHNITKESAKELDRIVQIMKENPALKIEAASHTDSRGPKAYNQRLSERRAKSTVNYIVSKGVSRDRITAKGYGESQLMNNCKDGVRCGIEKHKLNRRTEFVIVNKQVLNLPKNKTKPVTTAAPKEVKTISTPKVTSAPPKSPVKEGTSNDSSKGEIIFLSDEKETQETEVTPNEDLDQDKELPQLNLSSVQNKDVSKKINLDNYKKTVAKKEVVDNTATVVTENKKAAIKEKIATLTQKENDDATQAIEVAARRIKKDRKSSTNMSESIPKIKGKKFGKPVLADTANTVKENIKTSTTVKPSTIEVANNTNTEKRLPDRSKFEQAIKEITVASTTDQPTKTTKTQIEKPTLTSDFSVTEEVVEIRNVVVERESEDYKQFNRDFGKGGNNISSVSEVLFSDEDDFESYDDKAITANRFASKVKSSGPNMAAYDDTAFYKLQKAIVKKQFVESTKEIPREEVIVVNAIDVSPMSVKKNGMYKATEIANKVDVMRINFQIDNNEHITPGYKEVYILIQNPKGIILNRKGSFKMNNGETLTYTEKTNAFYNNNHLNLSMMTDRFIQKITKGIYTIIIYIEGYPVGLEMITLS